MIRTSVEMVFIPPTRSNSRSWMTRQQLDLDRGREVAHLVQEDRAPVGELEAPLLGLVGAGKRPLFVPEELALDNALRAVLRS